MNDTIFYLKSIFGNKIYFLYNEYERNFPLFLKDEFDFLKFQLSGNERKYILTKPKKKFDIKLNTIRKQQNQIEKWKSDSEEYLEKCFLKKRRTEQYESTLDDERTYKFRTYRRILSGPF